MGESNMTNRTQKNLKPQFVGGIPAGYLPSVAEDLNTGLLWKKMQSVREEDLNRDLWITSPAP